MVWAARELCPFPQRLRWRVTWGHWRIGEESLHVAIMLGSIPRWPQNSHPLLDIPCIISEMWNKMSLLSRLGYVLWPSIWVGLTYVREPFKSERWGSQRFKIWAGFDGLLLVWRFRGLHDKECRWSLGAGSEPQMQPAWKWELSPTTARNRICHTATRAWMKVPNSRWNPA